MAIPTFNIKLSGILVITRRKIIFLVVICVSVNFILLRRYRSKFRAEKNVCVADGGILFAQLIWWVIISDIGRR